MTLLRGDCFSKLLTLESGSVDACVTDPPYGIAFMGHEWDRPRLDASQAARRDAGKPFAAGAGYTTTTEDREYQAWCERWAAEVLRVLKPGGYLLAFSATRTYHRLACGIQDAGFVPRDMIAWLYGCLDDQSRAVTPDGFATYDTLSRGSMVLSYDSIKDEYRYEPVQEVYTYDVCDTAYRLVGPNGEQIVSRGHRCLVERDGKFVFVQADALMGEETVPVLEELPEVRRSLSVSHHCDGQQEQVLRPVSRKSDFGVEEGPQDQDTRRILDGASYLHSVRCGIHQAEIVDAQQRKATDMLTEVQRSESRKGTCQAFAQGPGRVDAREQSQLRGEDDRREQPGMEGRPDLPPAQRGIREPADQVRSRPIRVRGDGPEGRVCDGASASGRAHIGTVLDEGRECPPHQPRRDGQPLGEPDAVPHESRSQTVRASRHTQAHRVRVVPIRYRGVFWCVRVQTGAFVAERNGHVFPTGNSGFPKSHNDGALGTALKPAHEPIMLAQKPREGTYAANHEAHGTGYLNIDDARVPLVNGDGVVQFGTTGRRSFMPGGERAPNKNLGPSTEQGRWPANVTHDGSDAVLAEFPQSSSSPYPGGRQADSVNGWQGTGIGCGAGGFSDKGNAARFFYCGKPSPAEKEAGVDNSRIVVKLESWKNDTRGSDLPKTVQKALCRAVTDALAQTDTAAFGGTDAIKWSIGSSGSGITARSPMGCQYITGITTHSTTLSTISNLLTRSLTSASIPGVRLSMECGTSRAESAERFIQCRITTSDELDSPLGADLAALPTRLRISASVERVGHPTVKPIALMQWLIRLVTPPGGTVLDPFLGSGTTAIAAVLEGRPWIGVEREDEYAAIAQARIDWWTARRERWPGKSVAEILKVVPKPAPKPSATAALF